MSKTYLHPISHNIGYPSQPCEKNKYISIVDGQKFNRILVAVYFLTLVFICAQVQAQSQPIYTFYKDDSILRKKYYNQAVQKNNELLVALPKANKDEYKSIYNSRFKEVENLLTTSRSITAPSANNYLQALVQKIVLTNPVLKNADLRVLFTRDWWPNAYSLGDGTFGINAGLVVFLDNEAELAFVLCHELAHYHLDHSGKSINKYVETVTDPDFQKELKRLSKQQYRVNSQLDKLGKNIAFDGRKHSRDHEAQSDSLAVVFMHNAGYDCRASTTTLQLLDKIDDSLLFSPIKVEVVFNFENYPFKKKWIQKESSIFSEVSDKDDQLSVGERDSLKTHPDCAQRIAALQPAVLAAGEKGKNFIVDEPAFLKLKNTLIAEITQYSYDKNNLSRNLYYSLQLLQSGKERPLAIYSVARCLNDIYLKQQQHKLGLSLDREGKTYAADYNQLLRMLDRLRLDELAAININFCRKYEQEMTNYEGFRQEMLKALNLK